MNEIDRLKTLLDHWQTHETEHASNYCSWAKKAHAAGLTEAGDALERAAMSSERNRRLFAEALEALTAGYDKKKSSLALPVLPVSGRAALPERLYALNETQRSAVLATAADQYPYTSMVSFALTPDLKGALFLTPRNTVKYKNLMRSAHVALLMDNRTNTTQDLLGAEAITLIGAAKPVRKGKKRDELLKIFLKKHPKMKAFASAETTALVFIEAERYIHVSQFQAVTVWEVNAK